MVIAHSVLHHRCVLLFAWADAAPTPMQQFYQNRTVFLTGGTGFLGKVIMEKLLRCCQIDTIYVLIRSKKGKDIATRIEDIVNDVVSKFYSILSDVNIMEGQCMILEINIRRDEWFNENKIECNAHFTMSASSVWQNILKNLNWFRAEPMAKQRENTYTLKKDFLWEKKEKSTYMNKAGNVMHCEIVWSWDGLLCKCTWLTPLINLYSPVYFPHHFQLKRKQNKKYWK